MWKEVLDFKFDSESWQIDGKNESRKFTAPANVNQESKVACGKFWARSDQKENAVNGRVGMSWRQISKI